MGSLRKLAGWNLQSTKLIQVKFTQNLYLHYENVYQAYTIHLNVSCLKFTKALIQYLALDADLYTSITKKCSSEELEIHHQWKSFLHVPEVLMNVDL